MICHCVGNDVTVILWEPRKFGQDLSINMAESCSIKCCLVMLLSFFSRREECYIINLCTSGFFFLKFWIIYYVACWFGSRSCKVCQMSILGRKGLFLWLNIQSLNYLQSYQVWWTFKLYWNISLQLSWI